MGPQIKIVCPRTTEVLRPKVRSKQRDDNKNQYRETTTNRALKRFLTLLVYLLERFLDL